LENEPNYIELLESMRKRFFLRRRDAIKNQILNEIESASKSIKIIDEALDDEKKFLLKGGGEAEVTGLS
jgi:hypothetical protein